MLGWFRADAACASRRKRAKACGSLATSSGRNFSATKRRSRCLRPCRPRPFRRRRASRRCGSARWSGRSCLPCRSKYYPAASDATPFTPRFRINRRWQSGWILSLLSPTLIVWRLPQAALTGRRVGTNRLVSKSPAKLSHLLPTTSSTFYFQSLSRAGRFGEGLACRLH